MSLKLALLLVIFSLYHHAHTTSASDPDPIQDFCIPNPKFGITELAHLTILPCKNSSEATADDFVFSGLKSAGNFSETGLATIPVNPVIFPGLNTLGMSFVRADLKPDAVNPPHFHPRATEISYVVQGSVYAGFVDSSNRVFARVIEQGEVMVFPRGLAHFQMNLGDKPATVFGSFNSQNPGSQKIPSAIFGSGIDAKLLEKAFGLSPKQIGTMRRKFDPKTVR
ncbi:germin-like protein subfamily 3 member 2 [Mangifera indica]|uniref:germin-like protein subfamily 3 member 2 n=1 Tax=Mangifera indica TaxID=29780 RepID=UPI001CFC27D2|nr:germin-like protein subfamily 3 member 2 [Mangifera indica]